MTPYIEKVKRIVYSVFGGPMNYYFEQSKDKTQWYLFLLRSDGSMVWIATRNSLSALRALVA